MLAQRWKIITILLSLSVVSMPLGCIAYPPGLQLAPSLAYPKVLMVSKNAPAPAPAIHSSAKITGVKFKEGLDSWLGITATIRNTGDATLTGDTLATIEGPARSILSRKLSNIPIVRGMSLVPGREMPYTNPAVSDVSNRGRYRVKIWIEDDTGKALDTYYGYYLSAGN